MVNSWRLWASAALALGPFVAAADYTEAVTAGETTVTVISAVYFPTIKVENTTVPSTAILTTTVATAPTATVVITTQPATTVITTTPFSTRLVTTAMPPMTVTFTGQGSTVLTTIPGSAMVKTETVALQPETQTWATVTVSPAPACPAPSASGLRQRPTTRNNEKWGCAPGLLCSPPKPEGCLVWDSAPPSDFVCKPEDCIVPPVLRRVQWTEGETGYFPPSPGYFNLDPRAFGLSPGIFEQTEVIKIVDGVSEVFTTGIWASQSSLSVYPHPEPTSGVVPPAKSRRSSPGLIKNLIRRAKKGLVRRQSGQDAIIPGSAAPAACFTPCNSAFQEAQRITQRPELCRPNSAYNNLLDTCLGCVDERRNGTLASGGRQYLVNEFVDYLEYCESSPALTSAPTSPGAIGTATDDITTASQGSANPTSDPEPITTSSSSSGTGTSSSTSSGTDTSGVSISPSSEANSTTTGTSTSTSTLSVTGTPTIPGTSGTLPTNIATAGADASRQPMLATMFVILAPVFFF